MPAPTTLNRPWDLLFTTTMDAYRPKFTDNVSSGVGLYYALTKRGRGQGVRYESGGHHIMIPILINKNPNAGFMSGYDRIPLATTDEGTAAFEPWANGWGSVGISFDETQQNKAPYQRDNLVRRKINMLETSMVEVIDKGITMGAVASTTRFGRATAKDPLPLAAIIAKVQAAASGTKLHNVDEFENLTWMNRIKVSAANSWVTARAELVNIYNTTKRGATNDGPDFGLMTQDVYEMIENGMISIQRLPAPIDDETAGLGFGGLRFKSMIMMWSETVGSYGANSGAQVSLTPAAATGVMFLINTGKLEVVVDPDVNFALWPFDEPVDQFAAWTKMLHRFQLTTIERRKQGLWYNINTTACVPTI
jgi:hypothetical protein